jgi:dihydroorotate dehydrogenase
VPLVYRLLRAPLFRLPAERAHGVVTGALDRLLAPSSIRHAARRLLAVNAPELRISRWGIDFPSPIGLAAGFDKSGASINPLAALGFGFLEVGTVTAEPQAGNPQPRLFRLPADGALLNRMGFNNPGAAAVAERLRGTAIEPILGVNVGKSRVTPLDRATEDYLRSVRLLRPYAAYLVVNVSSPNTPGLRSLQDAGPLRELVGAVVEAVREPGAARECPVLVKLAPDLSDAQVEEAVEIAVGAGAAGIVATNTTISREGLRTPPAEVERLGAGGISGDPLRRRALEVVARVYRHTAGRVPIVGVGGIRTVDDAWERILAGASLLQVYTGFVYEGPGLPRRLALGLLDRLREHGWSTLEEAVGAAGR